MTTWFTSTFQSVRDQSLYAIEFVRNDLADFTTTVKTDTENYLNKVKSQPVVDFGIHRIVSRLSHSGKSEGDHEKHLAASASFDRLQNERVRLQNDESTYLVDPIPTETYKTYDCKVENRKGEIAQLLIDVPHVRAMYTRLVPACTSHGNFWSRYYFRLQQLDEEEIRRMNLLKRAHEICNKTHGDDWEDPDDDEWSKDLSPGNQQSSTVTEGKESDIGDGWEREFDETISQNETDLHQETALSNHSRLPDTVEKQADNEFDDEWESWS